MNEADRRTEELVYWLRDYACHQLHSHLWDERRCFPPHVILDLARAGMFTIGIPREYGGNPLPVSSALRLIAQLAALDTTLAGVVGVNEALGIRPLVRSGSKDAKGRYLPELAQGRMLGALALTEAGAGSDPRGLAASAARCNASEYLLNGSKHWIGNAAWAGVIHVFARIDRAEDHAAEVAGFCVDARSAGVRVGAEALTMGMRAMVQNEVHLENVRVGEEARLGAVGQGTRVLLDTLNFGRLGIAAMSLGAMQRAVQLLLRYASRRRIATGRLLDHPDVGDCFARAAGAIELTQTLLDFLAKKLDAGEQPHDAWFAVAKIIVPELCWNVVDDSLQRLGGRGYVETNYLPRLFRDARLFRIFEGPTEALASYLGSYALGDEKGLSSLFDGLQAPALAETFRELCGLAHAITGDRKRTAAERRLCVQRVSFELGLWMAHALLQGLCNTHERHGGCQLAGAGRSRAESRLRATLQGDVAEHSAEAIAAWSEAVRAAIGDVDLLAERTLLDPLIALTP